jgi:hypothetical protein
VTVIDLVTRRPPVEPPTTDDAWVRVWLPDEAVWEARHNPTGLAERFADINSLVAWTADEPAALADLRRVALETLTAEFALTSEKDRAGRALMLLADPPTLMPYTTHPDLIEAVCVCGGYLGYAPGRILTHIDICAEELHAPGQPCPDDRNTHKVCAAPAVAVCGHEHCLAPNKVNALPCLMAKDLCCACCHGDPR